jgi:hypothetical protein
MRTSKPSEPPRGVRAATAVVAAGLLGMSACMPTVSGSGTTATNVPRSASIQGPYVPAGQRLVVQLDQAIDTMESLRRGTFTAHLVAPLVGADGRVIAATGATVHGFVRSLGSVDYPRISLRFESVDTVYGSAPLPARVRNAQYRTYLGPALYGAAPAEPYGAWGGGPGAFYGAGLGYGYYGDWYYAPYYPREVHMPAGAQLELQLSQPLVPPGSTVVQAPRH